MPTNTYEQGYAGSSNGQHLPSDGEEAARQWITDVRQGKIAPPPICKWIGALKAALHVYQTAGLDAFNATLESYAQNVKLYAGLASVLRPRQKKKTESHARGDQDGD